MGTALPLVALAAWFGLVDRLPFGESRCSSCGVEGYVIAAHVVTAGWLAAMVAWASAVRRRVTEGVAAPGQRTLAALAAVAAFVSASLLWHDLFSLPALAAMVASLGLFPVAAVWWVLTAVRDRGRPPRSDAELRARWTAALAGAWVALAVLLPAIFAWVWADRVQWLTF